MTTPSFGRPLRGLGALGVSGACLLALCSSPARADVRARAASGDADLSVRVTPRGPWTLLETDDETVLNPLGDLHGDGLPGSAPRERKLLAAWIRPADETLLTARWDGETWTDAEAAPDESDAIGTPRVAAVGDGWGVTWQRTVPHPQIAMRGHGEREGASNPRAMLDGWLVDTRFDGEIQWVLFETPNRRELRLAAIIWSVPGVPSPVDVVFLSEAGSIQQHSAGGSNDGPRLGRWRDAEATVFRAGTASLAASEWDESIVVVGLDPRGSTVALEASLSDGRTLPVAPPSPPRDVTPSSHRSAAVSR